MSWLARSLVNSFRANEDEEDDPFVKESNAVGPSSQPHSDEDPSSPSRKVKEDISELTKTITRQFWGVASFLAPPPPDIPSEPIQEEQEAEESPRITGIRSDFAELGNRFKSGISMLSNTKAVSEISKIASTFLPFSEENDEEEEEGELGAVAGITEDVLLFVRNISMHPETWLDFPLIAEDEDFDDFKMSDAQQEHGLAVERLEPSLAALRIEIVRARAMLLQDLRTRPKPIPQAPAQDSSSAKEDGHNDPPLPGEEIVSIIPVSGVISSPSPPSTPPPAKEASVSIPITDIETEKHSVETTVVTIVDKSVTEEGPSVQPKSKDLQADVSHAQKRKDEDDEDDWLDEETGEASGSGGNVPPLGNDEDVSFSDLEEDDGLSISKSVPTQVKESTSWVQLNTNSGNPAKSRNSAGSQNKDEWLNVDEDDAK